MQERAQATAYRRAQQQQGTVAQPWLGDILVQQWAQVRDHGVLVVVTLLLPLLQMSLAAQEQLQEQEQATLHATLVSASAYLQLQQALQAAAALLSLRLAVAHRKRWVGQAELLQLLQRAQGQLRRTPSMDLLHLHHLHHH